MEEYVAYFTLFLEAQTFFEITASRNFDRTQKGWEQRVGTDDYCTEQDGQMLSHSHIWKAGYLGGGFLPQSTPTDNEGWRCRLTDELGTPGRLVRRSMKRHTVLGEEGSRSFDRRGLGRCRVLGICIGVGPARDLERWAELGASEAESLPPLLQLRLRQLLPPPTPV